LSVEDKLKFCIVHGEKAIGADSHKQSLEQVLEDALKTYTPLDLINNVLLDGMRTVGELFGARKMQLPSVLDSASVMKQAVAYLEPRMEKVAGREKGTMVLATVKGDVHDIGKNLVDIILTNNGYKVVNLGIKQPADTIIKAAQEHKADVIGLSGLLVKSTLEMKYVIQDLQQQGLTFPVVCGGAALTRKYVEDDLRKEYSEAVFYAGDAFDGLHVMDDLTQSEEKREARLAEGRVAKEFAKAAAAAAADVSTERSAAVQAAPDIPRPPFWGARVARYIDLRKVFRYINETALFKNQWQLKTASQEDYLRVVKEKYRAILRGFEEEIIRERWFEPKVVWGYWPAQSEGNDVIVYEVEKVDGRRSTVNGQEDVIQTVPVLEGVDVRQKSRELVRFTFPRQKEGRRLCISDFFAPKSSGQMDVIGLSLVTIGHKASELTQKLFHSGEYTRYLYLHGISVEAAEALAELQHRKMRQELGIAGDDAPRISDLFHQKYRGSRFSFGYPACPHMEDQTKLFKLLRPEETIGVRLTTGFMLDPEQSTSAIVVHHPGAKYFVA
jgi:5-methyltetrahydrofolate--homocysteine methyltransferase